MAKKQTRRSVSIRGTTYEKVRKYCEENNVSMSEFVEARIAEFFGEAEKPAEERGGKVEGGQAAGSTTADQGGAEGKGKGRGKAKDEDESSRKLTQEELEEAARYFTF